MPTGSARPAERDAVLEGRGAHHSDGPRSSSWGWVDGVQLVAVTDTSSSISDK